jgi:hypothetical protein
MSDILDIGDMCAFAFAQLPTINQQDVNASF